MAAPGDLRLSGARWWHANEARYPNSSLLDDLAPGFHEQATSFVAALRAGGVTVRVSATRRNATRAKLMHYSWTVAHGQTAPDKVPATPGCDIVWTMATLPPRGLPHVKWRGCFISPTNRR